MYYKSLSLFVRNDYLLTIGQFQTSSQLQMRKRRHSYFEQTLTVLFAHKINPPVCIIK